MQVYLLNLKKSGPDYATQAVWNSPGIAEIKKLTFSKMQWIIKSVDPTMYAVFQAVPARSV